jgi:hypothetical protein
MKLRHLLKKLPLQSLEVGEDARAGEDNVDVLAVGTAHTHAAGTGDVAPLAPPSWVPSQQDERPRH